MSADAGEDDLGKSGNHQEKERSETRLSSPIRHTRVRTTVTPPCARGIRCHFTFPKKHFSVPRNRRVLLLPPCFCLRGILACAIAVVVFGGVEEVSKILLTEMRRHDKSDNARTHSHISDGSIAGATFRMLMVPSQHENFPAFTPFRMMTSFSY